MTLPLDAVRGITRSEIGMRLVPFGRRGCERRRIVAMGGGTGLPAVLRGLVDIAHPAIDLDALTAVVTATDDGGSSGWLREKFGVLPPGDIRNCLVALAGHEGSLAQFLQHRICDDVAGEVGHPIGNLLLTALTQMTGDFAKAIVQVGSVVGARGRVIPTTIDNVRLRAEMESGEVILGETAIVKDGLRISHLSLLPSARPLPDVVRALADADVIVIGPGSLYTSVLPNLLVEGIAAAVDRSSAIRVYVANLMTQPGETDGYSIDDHLRAIREHTGYDLFDCVLVHGGSLDAAAVERYAQQGSRPVGRASLLRFAGGARIVDGDLAVHDATGKIRHDPRALAGAIVRIIEDASALGDPR